MRATTTAVLAAAGMTVTGPGMAQSLTAARWFANPHLSDYRVGISRTSLGPIQVFPLGQILAGGVGVTLVGVAVDAAVVPNRAWPLYVIGGAGGGFLDLDRSSGLRLWRSASIGVGAELLRLGPLGSAAIEGRYQGFGGRSGSGISIGFRLGASIGRSESEGGYPRNRAGIAASAVGFAVDAMGTPYQWGGTTENGFDCSGLIQYAFGRVGLSVPRRSIDQAATGVEVGRIEADLRAGDILGFSAAPGGELTHVGLYLGDGRFIHSGSGGVQISRLSQADPQGRWWFERWITSRRVAD